MKVKGFTLIELLAVIVILAIIALIATPIILNIISDAKEESDKRSIDMYGNAVENAIAKYQLVNNKVPTSIEQLTIEYEGNKVECDTNIIYEDGNIYLANCKVNNKTVEYTYGTKAPGVYDENGVLLASWDELVNEYGLDVSKDYSNPTLDKSSKLNYILENNPKLKNTSELIIPVGVTSISFQAFEGCTSLKEINIPNSVTSIGHYAFNGCTSLQKINIPSSVTSIGGGAFYGCTNLTTVNYTGTTDDWANIYDEGGNDNLKSATINYNYIVH